MGGDSGLRCRYPPCAIHSAQCPAGSRPLCCPMATWTAPGCPGMLQSRQRHPHRGACRALPRLLQGHCTEGHVSPSRGLCILRSQPPANVNTTTSCR